jgi:hypothetical protein
LFFTTETTVLAGDIINYGPPASASQNMQSAVADDVRDQSDAALRSLDAALKAIAAAHAAGDVRQSEVAIQALDAALKEVDTTRAAVNAKHLAAVRSYHASDGESQTAVEEMKRRAEQQIAVEDEQYRQAEQQIAIEAAALHAATVQKTQARQQAAETTGGAHRSAISDASLLPSEKAALKTYDMLTLSEINALLPSERAAVNTARRVAKREADRAAREAWCEAHPEECGAQERAEAPREAAAQRAVRQGQKERDPRQQTQSVAPNAYGLGVNSDEFGRSHTYRTQDGQKLSPIFQGGVKRDAYGLGVHADEFGRAVYDGKP